MQSRIVVFDSVQKALKRRKKLKRIETKNKKKAREREKEIEKIDLFC